MAKKNIGKVSKAGRGIQSGDVCNAAIRNILTRISIDKYGKFDETKQDETLKFFDDKCPYTGKLLFDRNTGEWLVDIALDHIVPINREDCGLNVLGNFLVVAKEANGKKGRKSVEDFLLNSDYMVTQFDVTTRETRLAKIREFQNKYNSNTIELKELLKKDLNLIYSEIQKLLDVQTNRIKALLDGNKNIEHKDEILNSSCWTLTPEVISQRELMCRLRELLPCRFSEEDIKNFTQKEYSKETWGLSYPLLSKERIKTNGHDRYYAKDVPIGNESYYICNNWYQKQREKLREWLKKYQ